MIGGGLVEAICVNGEQYRDWLGLLETETANAAGCSRQDVSLRLEQGNILIQFFSRHVLTAAALLKLTQWT